MKRRNGNAHPNGARTGLVPPIQAVGLAFLLVAIPVIASAEDPVRGSLGSTVDTLLMAAHRLSPALRGAALDTAAAAAKASGADALDDPMITDNYQYYRNPNVFSGHAIMVTQAFPLWGKRGLRRDAAVAELEAVRGRERASQDELDERIKIAFARYYVATRAIAVNREVARLARGLRDATAARYGAGQGEQTAVIQALGEETSARVEMIRLEGDRDAARAQLNALIARPADAPLATPLRLRQLPPAVPAVAALVERARTSSPSLATETAEIRAAQTRRTLADRSWYPDVTVGVGPLIQTNNRPPGVAASIGLNIPLGWGRQSAEQGEATARLGAARQRYEAALLNIQGALGEAVARLTAARRTEALLGREALPQARAGLRSLAATYGPGRGDLSPVIDAQHRVHEVEFKLLIALLDGQAALAAIERLIGGDL